MTQPDTNPPNVSGCVSTHSIAITNDHGVYLVQCSCPPWTVPAVFSHAENAREFGAGHLIYQLAGRPADLGSALADLDAAVAAADPSWLDSLPPAHVLTKRS